jgi:hypothetical protein
LSIGLLQEQVGGRTGDLAIGTENQDLSQGRPPSPRSDR